MTLQETYDYIRLYFSREGAVLAKTNAIDNGPACRYRTPKGDKCAIGCLISDELYDKLRDKRDFNLDGLGSIYQLDACLSDREAKGENGILEELRAIIGGDSDPDRFEFLRHAQIAHDSQADDAAHFVYLLDGLARAKYLNVPVA